MKKKIFLIIFTFIIVGIIVWIGIFYWQNLRGVGPALKSPPEDIAEIINEFPLQLPPGFSISIFAENLGPARVMAIDPAGNLLVSITKEGKIVALPDRDGDGVADEVVTVLDKLDCPHGMVFRCLRGCRLYVAETDQVAIYDYNALDLKATNKTILFDLPPGGNHFTRTIIFNSDKRLLTSVGSTCNVCNEKDWRRAKILVSNPDGSDLKVYASGLRNAVFMAVHPITGETWATEMGRDLLGDDTPPDEINIIEEGKDYGWPFCYGKNIPDPFGKDIPASLCLSRSASHIDLQAHSAPLGLAFVPADSNWPEEYWNDLLVAYHGSWNRTVPTGYKIMRFELNEQGNYEGREDFISGWLTNKGALGRPVDILIQPNGIMYISDDKAGVIYRVVYTN
ncbi:PQQ-dependent sugar dehydrogenase [Patescibacteria group bacterium]|nr:PQQ-dependent sugar dehydrogenase [Patescibacteria group bacterium]